jgi:histidinol-phosphatase (PHP family)
MWANYHTHTHYCDGKGSFEDFLNKNQVKSIGFSSHAPLPFSSPWAMKQETLSTYFKEIQNLKNTETKIEIYLGLEVDYIPTLIGPSDFIQLDYTIGSVHFVDTFPDGTHWEVDGMHTLFLEGLKSIFKNDFRAVWSRYFELTRQMLKESPPTILGHLDKMKIQNLGNKFFTEDEPWYQQEIKKTIEVIKSSGVIVEVNTRGLYQKKSTTPYPSPWILELLKASNIPITLSSDAHHPSQLISEFESTAQLLLQIGFKKLRILTGNKWKEVNFNQNGINFE